MIHEIEPPTLELVMGRSLQADHDTTSILSAINLDDWQPVLDIMQSGYLHDREMHDNTYPSFAFRSMLNVTFSNSTEAAEPGQVIPEDMLSRFLRMSVEVPLTVRLSDDENDLLCVRLRLLYSRGFGSWVFDMLEWERCPSANPVEFEDSMDILKFHMQQYMADHFIDEYRRNEDLMLDHDLDGEEQDGMTVRWIQQFRAGLDEHLSKLQWYEGASFSMPEGWTVYDIDLSVAVHQEREEEQARHAQLRS
jgi:hypothetical protein